MTVHDLGCDRELNFLQYSRPTMFISPLNGSRKLNEKRGPSPSDPVRHIFLPILHKTSQLNIVTVAYMSAGNNRIN